MYTENRRTESTVNPETGEICRRCLDGLVNNFNATILEAIRCNMDIKFIGSGASAKAILYYITDYITKSQLKTHVAYSALELAIKKLEEYHPNESEKSIRAKRMLQKCAYALVSHQELSAQQVASYLMGLEDHFTSHYFRALYWTPFERHIEIEQPSPECYQSSPSTSNDLVHPEFEGRSLDDVNPIELSEEVHCSEHANEDPPTNESGKDGSSGLPSEITVSLDANGILHASVDPVTDYRLRGHELDNICVWDFITRTKKVTKNSVKTTKTTATDEDFDGDDIDEDLEEDSIDTDDVDEDIPDENVLMSIRRARPKIDFLEVHDQAESHLIYVTHPQNRSVPVTIGPGLPRRDRDDSYPRFCRLMLIFFKPWRQASDLRSDSQSWQDAYIEFLNTCSPEYIAKMNNMQLLHECRDSRDDHFAQRMNKAHNDTQPSRSKNATQIHDDFAYADCTENDILSHLLEVDDCHSQKKEKENLNVLHCLQYAEASGLYTAPLNKSIQQTNQIELPNQIEIADHMELEHNQYEEDLWVHEYEVRRDYLKKRSKPTIEPINMDASEGSNAQVHSEATYMNGCALRDALTAGPSIQPDYGQNVVDTQMDVDVDVQKVSEKWTLNEEQTRAFRIIAEHSMEDEPEHLRMFLSGPGGTGKSRVIDALSDFFAQ